MLQTHGIPLRAFLVSANAEFVTQMQQLWDCDTLCWQVFTAAEQVVEQLFNDPPQLLIADMSLPDMQGTQLIELVKSENVYKQVPAILCLDAEQMHQVSDWSQIDVDDFIVRPCEPEICKARVELTLTRIARSLDANPLSRLPGNTSIITFIQNNIDRKREFALGYIDLDNFKAFNDKYGFSRGDEALLMTARIVSNVVRAHSGPLSFVGHVGGDDFVFALPIENIEAACQRLVANFDAIVPRFYDREDREQGSIISKDRQGKTRTFPLMALSIAVVFYHDDNLKHYAEASAIAMQLKKIAKKDPRSNYVMDRRG